MKNGPGMSGEFFSSAYSLFATPTSSTDTDESHPRRRPHYMLVRLRRWVDEFGESNELPSRLVFDLLEHCNLATSQWKILEKALRVTVSLIDEDDDGHTVIQIQRTVSDNDDTVIENASTTSNADSIRTWTLRFNTKLSLTSSLKDESELCAWRHYDAELPPPYSSVVSSSSQTSPPVFGTVILLSLIKTLRKIGQSEGGRTPLYWRNI